MPVVVQATERRRCRGADVGIRVTIDGARAGVDAWKGEKLAECIGCVRASNGIAVGLECLDGPLVNLSFAEDAEHTTAEPPGGNLARPRICVVEERLDGGN